MEAALLLDPETYAGLSPADRARVAAVVLAGAPDAIAGQDDEALILGTRAAESAGRHLDAFRIRNAGEVAVRSEKSLGEDRLSARLGCRTEVELLQRLTRLSYGQLKKRIALDTDTRPAFSVSGAPVEPKFPHVAAALHQGLIDPETAALVTGMLNKVARRADPAMLAEAEAELVDAATGALAARLLRQAQAEQDSTANTPDNLADLEGPTNPDNLAGDPADAVVPDEGLALSYPQMLKLAHQWGACLDEDGPDPAEERAHSKRSLTLGSPKDGLVPLTGWLLPEVAAHLQRVFDAHSNPAARTTGTGPETADPETAGPSSNTDTATTAATATAPVLDGRTAAQKRHDILMTVVQAASRCEETPHLGGDTATLLVHVNAADLLDPQGYAQLEGIDVPVSSRIAHRTACTGAVQKVVFDTNGRIIGLGAKERTFTGHQRRAIAARDGGCVIPNCTIRAAWCEVHHVSPWARGGKTTIENGVLLCWHHHHSLEKSGWDIQMRNGVVQVKAPPWLDPGGTFVPAATSHTRQRARILAAHAGKTTPNRNAQSVHGPGPGSSGAGGSGGGSGGDEPPDPPAPTGGNHQAA
ncbi:HNH endonuclease signature motif containing protein [Zhihengliuella halotolerans]|uniref:HNH endonuclease n=1 Tax=Zhihengliuella halotolerans TaxID=370736 RepID=A0A4Q8ADD1_9MICC|nr:HNH endonuclease signature motif containing protein [Zhihengliuella halotolerans]RZU61655.1 HNH endonuclease [Zhihengliuella halotolerans]